MVNKLLVNSIIIIYIIYISIIIIYTENASFYFLYLR